MIEEIAFRSEGAFLRGLLFMPEHMAAKPPIAIMAHGTSATLRMVADKYADVFCRNGLAALFYDHRNFARSGGSPGRKSIPGSSVEGIGMPSLLPKRFPKTAATELHFGGTAAPGARW